MTDKRLAETTEEHEALLGLRQRLRDPLEVNALIVRRLAADEIGIMEERIRGLLARLDAVTKERDEWQLHAETWESRLVIVQAERDEAREQAEGGSYTAKPSRVEAITRADAAEADAEALAQALEQIASAEEMRANGALYTSPASRIARAALAARSKP